MMRTIAVLALGFVIGIAVAQGDAENQAAPHNDAIRLVLDKRAAELLAAETGAADEEGGRWFDTKPRTWTVRRPFGPGFIDSTHYFQVTYSIDGKPAGSWMVNTRTGVVAGPGESISPE